LFAILPALSFELLQEPMKRRAKDFLSMVLDDCAVAHDYLEKNPIKYAFERRASVIDL
jgi:hypothetical protein